MVNGATFGLAFGAAMAITLPAVAQVSGDIGLGKRLYQDKATCGFCHGWSGDGAGDPQSPGKSRSQRSLSVRQRQEVQELPYATSSLIMPNEPEA